MKTYNKGFASIILIIIIVIAGGYFSYEAVVRYQNTKELQQRISEAKDLLSRKVDIYFKPGIPESRVETFKEKIVNREEIQSFTYVSADQALEDFKKVHKTEGEELLKKFDTNPLGSHFSIILKETSQKQNFVSLIKTTDTDSIIDEVKE